MPGWTAASLFPQSLIRDWLNPKPTGPMTPEQKLRLSGGATRQALTTPAPAATPSSVVTPGATGPGTSTAAAGAGTVIIPGATSGANSATSVVPPATNAPPFLQGGANQPLPTQGVDAMAQLLEALGLGQKQDPKLVHAQTVLAQQQAMQVARGNEAARNRQDYEETLRSLQIQKNDPYSGSYRSQRFADMEKVLRRDGELNWVNLPDSYFSVPRRSGWSPMGGHTGSSGGPMGGF